MTRKKASAPYPLALMIFLMLLRRTGTSPSTLEKPATLNGTSDAAKAVEIARKNASAEINDTSIRTSKTFTLSIGGSGLDGTRKTDPYRVWSLGSTGLRSSTAASGDVKNSSTINQAASAAFEKMLNSRRTAAHRKYPNHYAAVYGSPDKTTTVRTYSNRDDNEHQAQIYDTDYYPTQNHPEYEDNYNVLPDDQSISTGYEEVPLQNPWRGTYMTQDQGYVGPPIATDPYIREPPGGAEPGSLTANRQGCSLTNRQFDCDGAGGTFLAVLGALGRDLWALLTLIATTIAPILIPLLALKMILVPIKILKFLKLIKLFVKIFIILPFFVRVVYPALVSSFNWQNFVSMMQQLMPSGFQKPHKPHRPHVGHLPLRPNSNDDQLQLDDDEEELELEGRRVNSTASDGDGEGEDDEEDEEEADQEMEEQNAWDLRACPTRLACEIGAFLSASTRNSFPEKLARFLARKAELVEARGKDHRLRRSETLDAFVIALGNKWSQHQCDVYSCPVLF